MTRRVLALLLAMVMVLGMVPMQIFATETEAVTEPVVTEQVETTAPAVSAEETETSEIPEESTTTPVEETTTATTEETVEYTFPEDVPVAVSLEDENTETEPETVPAAPAQVTITVAVSGVLASAQNGSVMVNKPVTVTDVNEDGKLSFEEALAAAHEAYCAQGADGLVVEGGSFGTGFATKLWGTDSQNNLFFMGNTPIAEGVSATAITAGAKLFAAVLSDNVYYADYYTFFDKTQATVYTGDTVTLNLNGFLGMGAGDALTPKALSGISVGTWDNGSFTALSGKTTDDSGNVTLSFDKAGTYYVTARGTVSEVIVTDYDYTSGTFGQEIQVDAPIIPPVCVVTVEEKTEPRISSLAVYASKAAYAAGNDPFAVTPAFISGVYTGYSASIPDYLTNVYLAGKVTPAPEETLKYNVSNNWGSWSGYNVQEDGSFANTAYFSTNGHAGVYLGSNKDQEYQIAISQYATLKSLAIDGVLDKDFDRDVTTYHAYVDGTATGVPITVTGYKDTYALTVNDQTVTKGEAYTLPYTWDETGKMLVTIQVSGAKRTDSTYTITLEKQPVVNAPFVLRESTEADYTVIDTASYVKDLYVIASASGDMTYQWFYNTTASTEGGTAIAEATASTYTPPITEVGTLYYYCQITNTGAERDNVTCSTPTRVTVDLDPTPVAALVNPGAALEGYAWDKGYVYSVGATEVTPLEVTASSQVEGTLSYQWYYSTARGYNNPSKTTISKATDTTYAPATDVSAANSTGRYYLCQVTNTFKGRTYTAYATTGETYNDYDVMGAYVFLTVTEASTPEFTKQPVGMFYMVGDSITNLSVSATCKDGGSLTYQWYVNTENTTEGATPVDKATSTTLKLGTAQETGTKYYYCVATNTIQGKTATATSDIVAITINSAESLLEGKFTGEGTEESPYLITSAEDYQTVADLVAQKVSFQGKFLKQTAENIELPADWQGIGCLIDPSVGHINKGNNLTAFSGTLDGGGNTITIPEGGLPLLAYVKGATVKNLNIFGKKIAGYGLVNHLEGVGLSGSAITIDNVTLKSGSSTQKAGFIGTYITNNSYGGCSTGFVVTIRNSKIEENVVVGYGADQKMIGSFAGRINGTIENCVSYATVKGTDYVGGILGTRDNSMGTCVVKDCQFYGTVAASGEHAGGIVGGGYENSSAPNAAVPSITDCTVVATITGKDKVGGILGGDSFVAQSWGTWNLTGNDFSGSVKATSGTYVGGTVGYLLSMNKCANISGNTFTETFGTDKGIGYVKYLDTSAKNPKAFDGTVVFDTSKGTDACPTVAGCGWKANYNRTDDPLGADARALSRVPKAPTLEVMVNNSSYKAENGNPQKAVLGEDNIFRIANRTTTAGYLWFALEKGTTLEYTLIQGSTSNKPNTYQTSKTSNNVYDGTTYTHYIATTYTMPMVARLVVSNNYGDKATYYVLMDKGEVGSYAISGTLTSDSQLFTAETGISFTEAGQTVTLTPKTKTVGTGEEKNAAWKYATSDNHVAVVNSDGVVTCVGGGTATITAKCDQITVTTTVTSTADEHKLHTYGEDGKCALCGDKKPGNVTAKFTLLDSQGKYMIAKDGETELYKASLTVSDLDCDGTVTYADLFIAAHDEFCAAGTDGFVTTDTVYGLFITKFWGEDTSDVGYYCNNKVVYNMTERITGTPNLVAFFYQDTTTYYDLYTWFEKDSSKTVTGYEKVFTVNGADGKAPKGATVTVLDETGNPVEALATTVDETGKFTITFTETGTYKVWVGGTADYTATWGEATGAHVIPCFQTVEVLEPKSAELYMTIVDGENNFVKTTDGKEVYRYAFKAVDDPENPDGKVTIYEALQQLHAQKCPAGAEGLDATETWVTDLWGLGCNSNVGYYFNDKFMSGYGFDTTGSNGRVFKDDLLATEIVDGAEDAFTIFVRRTYYGSVIYTYFAAPEETAVSGLSKTFTVLGDSRDSYGWGCDTEVPGAFVTVTDSQGRILEELTAITDENGQFSIAFPAAGKYTIDVVDDGSEYGPWYTHSRCVVTVSGVEAGKRVLLGGESTKLQIRNGTQVDKKVTWSLNPDDEAYVSMSVKNGVATIKAKDVSEKHIVTIGAVTGETELSASITILPRAQGIVLSQPQVTIDIGGDYEKPVFTATVLPADAEQSVTWKSSNKKVATVKDGKVTLTGTLGTTKITATTTDGTKRSATATVTVVKLAQSIVLSGKDTIRGGKTATYTAAETTGTAIKASNITWRLSDTTYASVDSSGKVTAKSVPETVKVTLTATIKGSERSATREITLIPAANYVDIRMGDEVSTGTTVITNVRRAEGAATMVLNAAVYPEGASQSVTWKSSNTKIATVDKEGVVTYAGKPGTVTITATASDGSGKKATMKITFAALATKVEIEEHAETLRSGEKLTLKASTDLAKVGVKWMLADPADKAYVTLSSNGTVKAKTVYEEHEVTFCAVSKDNGDMAETTLTIQPASDEVLVLKQGDKNVTKTTQTVDRSTEGYILTAANVAGEAQNVTWKTSNKKVVSLSETQGTEATLNLLKSGTATITATAEDGSKTTVTIKVTSLMTSLTISGSSTVASGKSITLKAVANSAASNKAVTWSLNSRYASISSSGKLTAAKNLMTEKTVTVVATAKDGSGVVAEKEVTIQPVATAIQVGQKSQKVDMQQTATLQLSANVYPASANQTVKWSSSSTKIATVNATGLVTFHRGGTVTITATTTDGSNRKSTVKLTVVKAVNTLSLDDNFLASGKSLNLAKLVKVGPADASNKKVTWRMTGDTAYATLSSSGTLKAKTVTEMKTVQVTATAADGYKASVTATITIYPATTKVLIQVDGDTATGTVKLPEGDSLQLSAVSLPLDAYQDWSWSSSKDAYAEVDQTGCVTGLKAGKTVTITAKAKDGTGKKATLRIQITAG